MNSDYYKILGISRSADEDEIKKAYRKLALKYHPDRNPGNRRSEEHFKKIAEAYAVLIDEKKRRDYDQLGQDNFHGHTGSGGGFQYRKEDIFQDMFRNPHSSDFFSELEKEFQRQGFRFNETFFNDLFTRKQGIFFGSIYFSNQAGGRLYTFGNKNSPEIRNFGRRAEDMVRPVAAAGLLKVIKGIRRALKGLSTFVSSPVSQLKSRKGRDLSYEIRISRKEAILGKEILFSFNRGTQVEKLVVRIPAGIENGTRLRLTGMGLRGGNKQEPGNLYLEIKVI
jgi:DnaJ-class molecular chaperone